MALNEYFSSILNFRISYFILVPFIAKETLLLEQIIFSQITILNVWKISGIFLFTFCLNFSLFARSLFYCFTIKYGFFCKLLLANLHSFCSTPIIFVSASHFSMYLNICILSIFDQFHIQRLWIIAATFLSNGAFDSFFFLHQAIAIVISCPCNLKSDFY